MIDKDTLCVHAGYEPDATGAVMPPIYLSSTYARREPGAPNEFEYARSGNPTRAALEKALAELEGGAAGFAFASGMAATATVLDLLPAGSEIVALDDLYGGTWRLFEAVRQRSAGLRVRYVPHGDSEALERAIVPGVAMVWVEIPSNPFLRVADLDAVARRAREAGALAVADATFATPWLLRPLEHGFDIVVHSLTKYINGHSDVVAGAAIARESDLAQRIACLQNATGAVLDPFASFLVMRGMRTLGLRMQRHVSNAQHVAQWLASQKLVAQVIYPGLPSHPDHGLATRLLPRGGGGMISLRLDADEEGIRRFLGALRLFRLAESLGGVESLVNQPWSMTHASLPVTVRRARGITPELLRFSIGIESGEDLVSDIAQALAQI